MAIQAVPAEVTGERGSARKLALAGLEARLGLVDDVNPALPADKLVVPMAATQRFQ
jgi:hypothetical protein